VAAEIKVLSAGAVKPGMVKVIDAFRRETGHDVKAVFATAPAILERIGGKEKLDAVIAPPAVLDEWVKAGKGIQADSFTVGRIELSHGSRRRTATKDRDHGRVQTILLGAESVALQSGLNRII
jgi:molybdate transport system substrate-binding protein